MAGTRPGRKRAAWSPVGVLTSLGSDVVRLQPPREAGWYLPYLTANGWGSKSTLAILRFYETINESTECLGHFGFHMIWNRGAYAPRKLHRRRVPVVGQSSMSREPARVGECVAVPEEWSICHARTLFAGSTAPADRTQRSRMSKSRWGRTAEGVQCVFGASLPQPDPSHTLCAFDASCRMAFWAAGVAEWPCSWRRPRRIPEEHK